MQKKIQEFFLQLCDQQVRNAGLKGFNVPKACQVFLDADWSLNMDFFTATLKKKHGPFVKAHQKYLL